VCYSYGYGWRSVQAVLGTTLLLASSNQLAPARPIHGTLLQILIASFSHLIFFATSDMVAAGSSSDRAAHFAAALAVCFGAAAIVASTSFTAFLHNLLSDSSRHPLSEGKQCDYGVVLGYALHRCGIVWELLRCARQHCRLLRVCTRSSMPVVCRLINGGVWQYAGRTHMCRICTADAFKHT
jgi:hypothetical protein